MDEARLIEKLRMIEALLAGVPPGGEREAAEQARERILERLRRSRELEPPGEFRFTMADMWSRKVFVALLRRYGIQPYRYSGQRYTTVMARLPKSFVDEILWPEFQEISDTLEMFFSDITDRVVHEVVHQDSSEARVVPRQRRIPGDLRDEGPKPGAGPEKPAPKTASQQADGNPSPSSGGKGLGSGGGKKGKRKKKKKKR
ncbi:MAG: hypothetical protein ACLFOY_08020 [Desulfatibacillaceae bacterium]